jgi:hypothetical protein
MESKAKYQLDDWVGAVRSDPKNTDQLTVLQGYLGTSSEEGHIRVYSDESLNDFVEVPEAAIVHAVKMTPAESALGGSKLWLRADSTITFGDPKLANRPKSTFLEGDIMQQYGASPAGQTDMNQMAGVMGAQGDTTGQGAQALATNQFVLCNPQGITLPARASVCLICPPSRVVFCPPRTLIASCFRTVCNFLTCRRTLCGPQSCIPVLCGGGGCQIGTQIPGTNSIACGPGFPGGPGGPVINPGAGVMGMAGQPDTTQMGGYYGAFNPYMY